MARIEQAAGLIKNTDDPRQIINWIFDLTSGAIGPQSVLEERVRRLLVHNKFLVANDRIVTRATTSAKGGQSLARLARRGQLKCTSITESENPDHYVALLRYKATVIHSEFIVERASLKIPELFSIQIIKEWVLSAIDTTLYSPRNPAG